MAESNRMSASSTKSMPRGRHFLPSLLAIGRKQIWLRLLPPSAFSPHAASRLVNTYINYIVSTRLVEKTSQRDLTRISTAAKVGAAFPPSFLLSWRHENNKTAEKGEDPKVLNAPARQTKLPHMVSCALAVFDGIN